VKSKTKSVRLKVYEKHVYKNYVYQNSTAVRRSIFTMYDIENYEVRQMMTLMFLPWKNRLEIDRRINIKR